MLPTLDAPEMMFGICAPIGTPVDRFLELLRVALARFDYSLERIKVTRLMQSVVLKDQRLVETPIEERYDTYIQYANKVRQITELNDALAILCCSAVRAHRRARDAKTYIKHQAYVFDQFKRDDEIRTLRQIYGASFILVSLYSDPEARLNYLVDRIASDHAASRPGSDHHSLAAALIRRDQEEEDVPHGQRLRDAFPLADLFLNMDDQTDTKIQLDRFLDLLFGSNKIGPTRHEYGMYMAKSAALRSLDLSRQVGAAIFNSEGDVVTMGCNDVPKGHGGLYWTGDSEDHRDYTIGRDENERIKKALLADVVRRFHLSKITDSRPVEVLIDYVLKESDRRGSPIREAQVMDLLEFGRMIHAEMAAITDAARQGLAVKGATLFCTTFPCHICAKHIVAAGIDRTVYIEPYPKSYAGQLYSDSLEVNSTRTKPNKVLFQPFIGVSPLRFRDLFERGRRKDDSGKFMDWVEGTPKPLLRYTVPIYMKNEVVISEALKKRLTALKNKKVIAIA